MEGNLLKWTNYIFGWRERYFVLKGSVLYYYYNKGDKPKGRIHLSVCQINPCETENRFEIDTGTAIIYVRADSKELRNEWVKALQKAKREVDNKAQANLLNLNNSLNMSNNLTNLLSVRGENNIDFSTSRNSVMTEDKLLKKINIVSQSVNKLLKDNTKFSDLIQKTKHSNSNSTLPDLEKLNSDYQNDVNVIFSQVDNLKKSFVRFNRDFVKLSEYFCNSNGLDIGSENIINPNSNDNNKRSRTPDKYDNNNLLHDNNVIELARNAAENEKMGMPSRSKAGVNNKLRKQSERSFNVIKKNEDVFYGADEDEEETPQYKEEGNQIKVDMQENATPVFKSRLEEEREKDNQLESDNLLVKKEDRKQKYYDPMYNNKRKNLPVKREKLNLNVWSILKDALGKDLSKFCVPGKLNNQFYKISYSLFQ